VFVNFVLKDDNCFVVSVPLILTPGFQQTNYLFSNSWTIWYFCYQSFIYKPYRAWDVYTCKVELPQA